MALLTEAQLATAAAHLGTPLDEDAVQERYDRLGSLDAAVLELLRERHATLLNGPASFAVSGVYQESNAETIRALGEKIAQLEAESTTLGGDAVRRVTLVSRRGR